MDIKLPKSSTILFINIFILLIFTIFVYILLYKNISLNKSKNQEVVFYQIKEKSSVLLTKILYKYSLVKDKILEKNSLAVELLKSGFSLDTIYNELNKEYESNPFNLYILNENLIIEDSSIFIDICQDLSYEKKDYANIITSVSVPEYVSELQKFASYINTKIPNSNKILQLSFSYNEFEEELKELQNFLNDNKDIHSYESFISFDNYIGNFTFKDIKSTKNRIDDIEMRFQKAQKVLNVLQNFNYQSYDEKIENDYFHIIYSIQDSPIFDKVKLIFYITFNENAYHEDILNIRLLSSIIFIIGALTIFLIYRLRTIELLLNYKDKFIAHSIHEIRTPLSIISINTQLREKLFGSDKFTNKIEGAIRTLENSYEDMTFLHTKDKIEYEIIDINLKRALENRVKYFDTIAHTQNRIIKLDIQNNYFLKMGKIELNRLVDNNISNAIKYSYIGSTINIILKDNILEFHSNGQKIHNPKGIFKRYKREDKNTGGHGLGLAIVSDICKKYNFKIEVESQDSINTFRYILS
ncbi:sensor histidine kinase [Aliarcobacter vitoriensis]|uniref:sensor histidine kinase n=1 Tax=Aliarcobacter vitoriensis TaxID=2011099 RepID=UPI003AAAD3DE